MQTTYKFELKNQLNYDEEFDLLKTLISWGGNTWFTHLLKVEEIEGRTKLVDSFRSGKSWQYDRVTHQGSYVTMPGRSDKDKEDSVQKLLQERPIEFWVQSYLNEFTLSSLTSCISNVIKRDFDYIVEVSQTV